MRSKGLTLFMVLVLSMSLLVACGGKLDPKQLMSDGFSKSVGMESYAFDGSMSLAVKFDESALEPEELIVASVLKDLSLNYKGVYQKDIEKLELIIEGAIDMGGMKTTIEIPVLIEGEKLWVKVPPLLAPELAGKYVEIDFNQLAEESGEEFGSLFNPDSEEETEVFIALLKEISSIVIKDMDSSYFTATKDGETVVTMDLSGERFYTALESVVKNTVPEIIERMEKNQKYMDLFNISQEDIEEFKNQYSETSEELELEELKEVLQFNKLEFTVNLNKDGLITKDNYVVDAVFTNPDTFGTIGIVFSMNTNVDKINEQQEFTIEVAEDQSVDFMEIFGSAMVGSLGFDQDFDETELERVEELQSMLLEQEWFDREDIEELLLTNEEFNDALFDEELLETLLNDEEARKVWFSQFNIDL